MRLALNSLLGIAVLSFTGTFGFTDSAHTASPPHDWSGFYLGLNVGGSWDTSRATTTAIPTGPLSFFGTCSECATTGNQNFHASQFTGGIQGGYNWQVGNLVTGIELDAEPFRNIGSITTSRAFPVSPTNTQTVNSTFNSQWLFTARPRLGLAADSFLFYGTGGLAVTRLNATWSYTDDFNAPCDCESAEVSSTRVGWILGGGIEDALPGNWLIGLEYLHTDFGTIFATSNNLMVPGGVHWTDTFNHSINLTTNIMRVRLSRQF